MVTGHNEGLIAAPQVALFCQLVKRHLLYFLNLTARRFKQPCDEFSVFRQPAVFLFADIIVKLSLPRIS